MIRASTDRCGRAPCAQRLPGALLLVVSLLAGCQYLQPRSVDDIERGRLPAPIERQDSTRSDGPSSLPAPGQEGAIDRAAGEEQARIAAQRDSAERDGVAVFSVAAVVAADFRAGSALSLQFVALGSREKGVVTVDLSCQDVPCADRAVVLGGQRSETRQSVMVLALTPGSWQLQAVQISEVSGTVPGGKTTLQLRKPLRFDVRAGHATYLGAFAVTGGARRGRDADGEKLETLPIVRFSNIEDDMTRALAEFPQARGRRMLNAARGLATPQPLL